jgi:hypothetical protein
MFGGDGNIIGLAAQPTTLAIPLPLVEPAPGDMRPDLAAYCWAPTADLVAYSNYADNELWVADLLNARIRISTESSRAPQWSPGGDRIAFTRGGTFSGIWTIKPNGRAPNASFRYVHLVLQPRPLVARRALLVFTGQSRLENNMDLFRATASGGNLVQLTSTLAPFLEHIFEWQGGWR